jgi:hypothetical protein
MWKQSSCRELQAGQPGVAMGVAVVLETRAADPKNPYVWDGRGPCPAVTFQGRSMLAQSAGIGAGIESWEIELETSTGYRHRVPVLALDGEQ